MGVADVVETDLTQVVLPTTNMLGNGVRHSVRNQVEEYGFVDIFVDPDAGLGLADQIYDQIRSGIFEGRLHPGDSLPPSRELAETLHVSRYTVTTAYGRLTAEGYLEGNSGGGTTVSDLFGQDLSSPRDLEIPTVDLGSFEAAPAAFDFRPGSPDPSLFPVTEWKRYVKWAIDQHRAEYSDPAGLADLRLILARWIKRSRGVDAGFRHLVVTSGAQQALYLLASVCAGPGDVVAIEDPGYRPFRRIAESIGIRIVAVPVDGEGIVVDQIPDDAGWESSPSN
jgi:GntR family transcriptional regulator/MocR family aminotransferase